MSALEWLSKSKQTFTIFILENGFRQNLGKERGVGTTLIGEQVRSRLGVPPILDKSKEVCRIQ
jgi:hypothetical protein